MALRVSMAVLAGLVSLYLLAGLAIFMWQRSLLYFPFTAEWPPERVGLADVRVERLRTRDGEDLVSWFLKGDLPLLAIYFHGNASSLAGKAHRIQDLRLQGLSVLAVDYRGFGGSTGQPTEAGLHVDAEAAYEHAIRLGFRPEQIILVGESLGSGVSLKLASQRPVAGLILDAPYSSVVDVAAARYWMFPVRLLIHDSFRSDLWIPTVHVPILIVHGTEDRTIPIAFGRTLARLGGAKVTMVEIEGGEHVVYDDPRAEAASRHFLRQFVPGAPQLSLQ